MFKIDHKIICGILNITPDSFSDGGLYMDREKAVGKAMEMIENGAEWIDIGGQSTRPFSMPVSYEEELKRVIPVIGEIRKKFSDIIISIDTYYPEVAYEAIKEGVDVINDITGLRNEKMTELVLKHRKPVVIMHMKGTPQTMQENPYYENVVLEIKEFFVNKIKELNKYGFDDIIIDPGIGFGKNLEHNIKIIKNLSAFKSLGYPLMLGVSRKSFIGKITGETEPVKRVYGTIASCLYAYNYCDIYRVHDVYEINQAFLVFEKLLG